MQENGYQLLFLSARSISQSYITRQFLLNIKQVMKSFHVQTSEEVILYETCNLLKLRMCFSAGSCFCIFSIQDIVLNLNILIAGKFNLLKNYTKSSFS